MIIPEGPVALPAFILLIPLDTISVVILIEGTSNGGLSLRFEAFHGNSTFTSF